MQIENTKDISIVVCSYNRCSLLKKTLDSLRAMDVSDGLQWEVNLIDNDSSDDTPEMVQEYIKQYPSFPLAYFHETKKGVAHARNTGINVSAGVLIAFIDSDITVLKTWLSHAITAYKEDPELAILGGRILPDPEGEAPAWLENLNTAPLGLVDYGDDPVEMDNCYLATGNCVFRKSDFQEAGLFDTRRGRRPDKLYSDEDTEVISRIMSHGRKVVYEPAITALHYVPKERMTKAYFRKWYREKGEGVGLIEPDTKRNLFGIKYFEYRIFLRSLKNYLLLVATGRPGFQQELFIIYFLGILKGVWIKKFGKSTI